MKVWHCFSVDYFTFKSGIIHHDLYFGDGTTPSVHIVEHFLQIVDKSSGNGVLQYLVLIVIGAIGVHCKGGIGRTGTLICAFLIGSHHFGADDAIAWVFIMCIPTD